MEITKQLKDKFYQETGIPWEHLTEREQLEIQLNGGLEIDQLESKETVSDCVAKWHSNQDWIDAAPYC